jgi:hypothetical protein
MTGEEHAEATLIARPTINCVVPDAHQAGQTNGGCNNHHDFKDMMLDRLLAGE